MANKKKKSELEEILSGTYDPTKHNTNIKKASSSKKEITNSKSNDKWFTTGAFEDGYDFGDATKTILGTAADIGLSAVKGIMNKGEYLGDLITYGEANVADKFGANAFADSLREEASKPLMESFFNPIEQTVAKNSIMGDKSDKIVEVLGDYAGTVAIGGAAGGLTKAAGYGTKAAATATTAAVRGETFLNSMGSSMGEAYQSGATDAEATTYGLISGTASVLTGMLFGSMGKFINVTGYNKGALSLDDQFAKKASSLFKSKLAKNLVEFGIKSSGEGAEEVAEGIIQAVGQKLTYASEEDLGKLINDQNLLEQFVIGAVVAGIAQTPGEQGVIRTTKNNQDFISGYTPNEQKVVDTELEQRIQTQEESKGSKLTNKEIANIREQVEEDFTKGKVSTDTIEKTLGKDYDYSNDNFLKQAYTERENKSKEFSYEASEKLGEFAKQTYESTKGKVNNTITTHEFVEGLAKLSEDRKMPYKLTNNAELEQLGKSVKGYTVNGLYEIDNNGQREILVNVDSKKYLEQVLVHETFHDFKNSTNTSLFTDIQDSTIEYAKAVGDYEKIVNEIKNDSYYKTLDEASQKEEITAKLLEDYVGNKDFINDLSTKKPSVVKQLIEEIKYLVKKFTAGSKEARKLIELQRTMEKAYKQAYRSDSSMSSNVEAKTSYSIQEDVNGKKYVKADRQVITGGNPKKWKEQVKNYINKQIRNGKDVEVLTETGDILTITENTAGKATFRNYYIDKNGKKCYMSDDKFRTKLSAEVHIDELGKVSQQKNKKTIPDRKNHEFAKDGFDYRTAFFEDYNGDYYMVTMSIGKNKNINTIYNVGKLEQRKRPLISGSSVKNGAKWVFSIDNISQNDNDVNNNISSTKYSMQKNENNAEIVTEEQVEQSLKEFRDYREQHSFDDTAKELQRKHNRLQTKWYQQTHPEEVERNRQKQYRELTDSEKMTRQVEEASYNIERMLDDGVDVDDLTIDNEIDDMPQYQKEIIDIESEEFENSGMTIEEAEEYNQDIRDKYYDALMKELEKEGISQRKDEGRDITYYDRQELATKGYDEMLRYLNKNNIDYEISRSTEAGHVPSIYIKDEDGTTLFRIANHDNGYIDENDMLTDPTYKTIFKDKDYANWRENIIPKMEDVTGIKTSDEGVKYSISENNIQELDDSSFSLEENHLNDGYPSAVNDKINKIPKEIQNLIFDEDFYKQYQYEDKTKITESIDELKSQVEEIDKNYTDDDFSRRYDFSSKIKALEKGYDSLYNYYVGEEKRRQAESYEYNPEKYNKLLEEQNKKIEKEKQLQSEIEEATPQKKAQYEIIQKTNPAPEGTKYVWIRSPKDIKTWEEIINDNDSEGFVWGDFSREDGEKALKEGKIRIYSSYAIKNGVFVSTSYQQALEYAGEDPSKVHSRVVSLDSVAWINGDEGQYAKINKYSLSNDNDILSASDGTLGSDIKLQVEDAIAPLQETIESLINEVQTLKGQTAPVDNDPFSQFYEEVVRPDIEGQEPNITPTLSQNDLGYIPQNPTKESTYNDSIMDYTSQERDRIIERIKKQKAEEGLASKKQKTKLRNLADTAKTLFVNKNNELDNMAKETGNNNIKFNADMLNNVYAEVSGDIDVAQTDTNGKAIGKSITQLFEPAKKAGLYEGFNDYLVQKNNIERHRQGKGSSIPSNVSEQLVHDYEATYPQFVQWASEVYKYNRNMLNNEVEGGLISKETAQFLTNDVYPSYVPFFQNENEDTTRYYDDKGNLKPIKIIKSSKGNAQDIAYIENSMIKQTYAYKKAIRQNQLYQEIVKTLSKGDIGNSMVGDMREDPTQLAENLYVDDNGDKYLSAYIDGGLETVQITDDVYNSLNNALEQQIKDLEQKMSLVTKPIQKISEIRRNLLTTWSPSFIIKNPIKDIQDAVLYSKYTKDMLKNYPSAFSELSKGSTETAKQFLTLYGSGNLMGEYATNSGVYEANTKAKNKNFLKKISSMNEIIELAPRYAEFKASLENGTSVQEAMYNARDITTNFSRGGVITKALNRNGFTFLNASVQGFDKLYRNFSGENGAKGIVSALTKAVMFGMLPAAFNHLAFDDDEDEEYEALPDYVKDNYYIFKTSDGEFVRVTKGRVISVLGSAARRTLELLGGEEDAFDGFLQNAYSQVGISNPLESNIFAPLIQAYGSENGKTWYGSDLIPTRLQNLPASEQADEGTDALSKFLGETLGISPYKLNYVLDQYLGGAGDVILPMMTEESQSEDDSILGYLTAPFKNEFTVNSTTDNKYVSDFYSKSEELTKLANSKNKTDEDVLKQKYMASVSSQMSKLYAERREVQNDQTLSKSEKYTKSQAIKQEINKLAEEGLKSFENIEKTSNYAIINDREYYKTKNSDGEDTWSKISDDELDTINSLGMDVQAKSSYFEAKSTINDIKDSYTTLIKEASTEEESNQLSQQRKEQILSVVKSSNLTSDEKYCLYDKVYGSTEEIETVKLIGIDADDYLDYSMQSFEADTTATGRAISGSKKRKVFSYINSMRNLDFEQKVILAKLEYPSYNQYNNEIIEYLNNSSISYEEEVKVLQKLGFIIGSNGTSVSWK